MQNLSATEAPDRKAIMHFIVGLTLGLIIGVFVPLVMIRASPQQSPPAGAQAAAAIVSPQRWFIWLGSAPAVGQRFSSEAECETGRKQFLSAQEAQLDAEAKMLAQMSIRQAVALGETPQTLIDRASQMRAAYCRAAD